MCCGSVLIACSVRIWFWWLLPEQRLLRTVVKLSAPESVPRSGTPESIPFPGGVTILSGIILKIELCEKLKHACEANQILLAGEVEREKKANQCPLAVGVQKTRENKKREP